MVQTVKVDRFIMYLNGALIYPCHTSTVIIFFLKIDGETHFLVVSCCYGSWNSTWTKSMAEQPNFAAWQANLHTGSTRMSREALAMDRGGTGHGCSRYIMYRAWWEFSTLVSLVQHRSGYTWSHIWSGSHHVNFQTRWKCHINFVSPKFVLQPWSLHPGPQIFQ